VSKGEIWAGNDRSFVSLRCRPPGDRLPTGGGDGLPLLDMPALRHPGAYYAPELVRVLPADPPPTSTCGAIRPSRPTAVVSAAASRTGSPWIPGST
jgi:hypothetical protein